MNDDVILGSNCGANLEEGWNCSGDERLNWYIQ
jgi:hypothetical protein